MPTFMVLLSKMFYSSVIQIINNKNNNNNNNSLNVITCGYQFLQALVYNKNTSLSTVTNQ